MNLGTTKRKTVAMYFTWPTQSAQAGREQAWQYFPEQENNTPCQSTLNGRVEVLSHS